MKSECSSRARRPPSGEPSRAKPSGDGRGNRSWFDTGDLAVIDDDGGTAGEARGRHADRRIGLTLGGKTIDVRVSLSCASRPPWVSTPERPGASTLTCSARGCRAPAAFELRWNNPKLHTPDRRKTWLACSDHREQLADFLGARSFLREVVEISHGSG